MTEELIKKFEAPPMVVELVGCTDNAAQILVMSKHARLDRDFTLADALDMSEDEISKELEYISNTIPSSWEFVEYTFMIRNVSRTFTHQFVRHRVASFAQSTTRIAQNAEFKVRFPPKLTDAQKSLVSTELECIRKIYEHLTNSGCTPEMARCILPQSVTTDIMCKFNLRSMSELAATRLGGRVEGEHRDAVAEMMKLILIVHPWAANFLFPCPFDDELAEIDHNAKLLRVGESNINDIISKDIMKAVDRIRKLAMHDLEKENLRSAERNANGID